MTDDKPEHFRAFAKGPRPGAWRVVDSRHELFDTVNLFGTAATWPTAAVAPAPLYCCVGAANTYK
jgi:hypothetical protein